LHAEDFADLYSVASDPLIWEQHPSSDRYKREVFEGFFREAMESGGAFVAIDLANRRVIGSSRYLGYDPEKSEIEIGFTFLSRQYWGGVYNGEMKQLMLEHAFQFVKNVIFVIGTRNRRSQMAIEKIGAVRVGTKIDKFSRDNFVYRIERAE
jgi:RimJ/RimL family protein N-acetyltransferase